MKNFILMLLLPLTLLAQSAVDQTFEGTQGLTDEEMTNANNYVHSGLMDRTLQEECAKGTLTKEFGCNDQSAAPGQVLKGQMGQAVEEMIPKLYGMIGMISAMGSKGGGSGGMNQIKMKDKGGKPQDEKTDVCIYIPTLGEVAMAAWQKTVENKIAEPTPAEDPQRDGLFRVARIHEQRAKTAKGQSAIYGATSACYVAYLASGAVFDWKMGLKIAAAGGLTYLFIKKAKNHNAYAEALKAIAKKLPGKGDCNPATATQCFCAEKTSATTDPANYQKACMLKELAGRGNNPRNIPCFKNGPRGVPVPDYGCECKKNNSCFQNDIGNMMSTVGLGGSFASDAMKGLELIGGGQFDDAAIDGYTQNTSAIAKSMNAKNPVGDLPAGLVPKMGKEADDFRAAGMNAGFAAIAAGSAPGGAPGTGSAPTPAPSIRGQKNGPNEIETKTAGQYNKASIGSSSKRGKKDDFVNPFGAKTKSASGGILDTTAYEERAVNEADITKDKASDLFDIISYRYKSSMKDKLKSEINNP